MNNFKFLLSLILAIIIFTGCSYFNKLKEKLDYKNKKEITVQESKEPSYDDDIIFYNKYTDAINKLRESGEGVYKDYLRDIPVTSGINKNTLIIPVGLSLSVAGFERTLKEYKRSLFDSGELSKLKASETMKNEVEPELKNLLNTMDEYYLIAKKVADYYSVYEFKNDLSRIKPYDEEIKSAYVKYTEAVSRLSSALKKYKPKREKRDPDSFSNPDERSSELMIGSYGDILDAAEEFYESFSKLKFKGNDNEALKYFREYERIFEQKKQNVLSAEFTEKTKFMKYNFEDYFSKTSDKFTASGNKFFSDYRNFKSEEVFKNKYNEVIVNYNYMVQSYNTSISSINSVMKIR